MMIMILIVLQNNFTYFQRNLKGHVSDINFCRFFPSGVVILSGGADMMLKVWSAETGQCAATFTGHTGGR